MINIIIILHWQFANMEQVADEVKSALKRFFLSNQIDKEEYKDIMRKAVPKVTTEFCTMVFMAILLNCN